MTANDGSLSLRLPSDVIEALRQAAERDGITVSDLLRAAAMEKLGYCPTCKRSYAAG